MFPARFSRHDSPIPRDINPRESQRVHVNQEILISNGDAHRRSLRTSTLVITSQAQKNIN